MNDNASNDKASQPPVRKRKASLRLVGMGGALGTCVAVAWLVPAMADPGAPSSRSTATIVGNIVGGVDDLDLLRSSLAGPLSSSTSADLAVASSEPPAPVLSITGAATTPAVIVQPAAGFSVPATLGSGSPTVGTTSAPGAEVSPAVQPLAAPAVVDIGGSSVGTTSSDGGGGGDSSATVAPTAVSGSTGSAQSLSSSSNSGDTGNATSSAISNPSSSSGGSGESGSSGATESTPSVDNSGTL